MFDEESGYFILGIRGNEDFELASTLIKAPLSGK